MHGLWGFAVVSLVLTVTPGPDDVLVLRSSLHGGPRLGAATALGAGAGSLVWGAVSACGLAAVVTGAPLAYDAMRLAGAGYLTALGLAPLVGSMRGNRPAEPVEPTPSGRPRRPRWSAFATGLASDLLNPKIGIFYVAVVPLFVPTGAPVIRYALLLCALDVAVAVVWLLGLSWTAAVAADWLRRPRVVRWCDRTLSACLVGVGAGMAVGLL
jgi:threonine/homoserine/homoserine lactone efflux protein